MQLVINTAPTSEPITVSELKTHLRIDADDYSTNEDLVNIIRTGREHVENITSRKLFTQTWNYYIDAFPAKRYIKIPFGNLQSIAHVKYTDSDGTQTTMTVNTEYIVETNGSQCGRIVLPYSVAWPSFTAYTSNPIVIQFLCGWTTIPAIPSTIKSAIKLICGNLYANRESQVLSGQDYRNNSTVMNLLYNEILRDNFI